MATQKTLVGAIEDIANKIGGAAGDIVDTLAVYQNAVSRAVGQKSGEELELCYTVGTLEFILSKVKSVDVVYGLLDMDLFNLNGQWNGRYQVIWKPEIDSVDLTKVPADKYTGPWDKVEKTISTYPPRANSNAAYRFEGNGGTPKGTLYATGPANLLLTPLKAGGAMFQVAVASYVTGGTHDFDGARGTNTALGSSYIPEGASLSPPPIGMKMPGVTVSTFRIVRKENQA